MLRGARREKCKSMEMTMTQKILAAHAGLPEVKAGDLIEAKFLTEGNWNVGSALSLIMMVLILISLSILRKADPNGEGGGIA